jgi:hypothetical protein
MKLAMGLMSGALMLAMIQPAHVQAGRTGEVAAAGGAKQSAEQCPEVTLQGSLLKARVCREEMLTWQGADLGELLRRDALRGFTQSKSYPGLDVHVGAGTGATSR